MKILLLSILFAAAVLRVSWISTCGVIYLITLCFNWTFNWGIATGIWLIMMLVGSALKTTVTVKK